jgi:hypothetical protein
LIHTSGISGQVDLPLRPNNENAEESYEDTVESILSLADTGYRRLLLSVHDERPGGGLAAVSWTGQKRNFTGKRTFALLA